MDSKALQYSFGFTHPLVVLDPFWGRAFWPFWDLEAWSTINHQRSGRYTPRKTPTAQLFKGHKEGKNHPISNVVRLLLLSVLWADLSMKKIEKGYPPSKRRPYYKGRCHCLTVARSIKYNRGWYTKNLFFTQRYTNPYKWNGIWNKIHIPTIQVEMSQVTFIPDNINQQHPPASRSSKIRRCVPSNLSKNWAAKQHPN